LVGWRTSKYAVLLAVLALHALLLTALMMWRGSIRTERPGRPLEIAFLPQRPRQEKIILPRLPAALAPANPKIDEPTLMLLPPRPGEDGFPAINWAAEARRAADSAAKSDTSPPAKTQQSAPAGTADWFPSSKYRAGDEVGLGNGDTAIFINDHCYQVAPMIPAIVDALHNGMGLHTFCKGGAKDPNGDLFKDTQAYKKLHPAK
jgi:hypothetical protein